MQLSFDRLSQCLTAEPAFSTFSLQEKGGLFFLYPYRRAIEKYDALKRIVCRRVTGVFALIYIFAMVLLVTM